MAADRIEARDLETMLLGLLTMGSPEDTPGRFELLHEVFMRTSESKWRNWDLDRRMATLMEINSRRLTMALHGIPSSEWSSYE